MEPMTLNRFKCESGYLHYVGEDCNGHEATVAAPYRLPKGHDTVVVDKNNRIIRSYSLREKERHVRAVTEEVF